MPRAKPHRQEDELYGHAARHEPDEGVDRIGLDEGRQANRDLGRRQELLSYMGTTEEALGCQEEGPHSHASEEPEVGSTP